MGGLICDGADQSQFQDNSSDLLPKGNDAEILFSISEENRLKLQEGYELAVKSADIDGNKLYSELYKNGRMIGSRIIIPSNDIADTFVHPRPETGDGHKIAVHLKNVFRGVVYDIVTIDGVYQTSKIHPHRIQLNESDLKTIASGMPLELEEGYDLVLHSVDIDGNKARLDLRKGEEVIDSQLILPANQIYDTFLYSRPGTSQEIRVHFKNAFRGANKNLVTIDHIWQNSEENPDLVLINDSRSLTITTEMPLSLDEGYELTAQSVDIGGNKIYLELSKDGEVVASKVIISANEVDDTFIYSKPGTSQEIRVHFKNAFRGVNKNLVTIDHIWQNSEENPDLVLINGSRSLTITTEMPLSLDEGYELTAQSVDIDGDKTYLELSKDGEVVSSQVVIPANEVDDTFIYSKPGTSQVIRVHFKNAFRGANKNLVTIDHIWQNSEKNPYLVLINDSRSLTIATEMHLLLDEGYELTAQSVDVDGNKTYLELSKDGEVIASKVIISANEVADTFVYIEPGTQKELIVHFKNAFRGAEGGFATIDRISQ
ncbi:MAG: S-layer protein domain-containing protein [Methanothrix sp.]